MTQFKLLMEKGKQCFVTRQKSLLPIQLIRLCTKAKGYFREVIIFFVEKKLMKVK